MQLSSSLSGAPVSVAASASASGASIGAESRKLNATTQRIPDAGVVVELSPAAEAFLERQKSAGGADSSDPSGNPLAPSGLSDVMADVELFGAAEETGMQGVFQLYENPALAESQESDDSSEAPQVEVAESSDDENPGEMSEEERAVVEKLKSRDSAVRAHEMAHVAAAGGLAGAPVYSYQTGPDGRRYAIGGSVSIDTSSERSPEDTIAKAQRIRSAALAPADPSAQDRAVASRASRMEAQARQALAQRQADETSRANEQAVQALEPANGTEGGESATGTDALESTSSNVRVTRADVGSVIPGGIATLASERHQVSGGSGSAILRSEGRQLYAFSGGSAAVAQLYTPSERSLEAAFQLFAS